MALEKFSLGVGDRFGREGQAQLRALEMARRMGAQITPVWNKSHREHTLTGTTPQDTRRRADRAVRAGGWTDAYYVDADHINMRTVDDYIGPCDFFTIDVADLISRPPAVESATAYLKAVSGLKGELRIPGLRSRLEITETLLADVALKYLSAVEEAGRIYRRIAEKKAPTDFVIEVSFDEADSPQTPEELLLILAAVGRQGIPIRTIAPKFSGSFLKGVDYVGDPGTSAASSRPTWPSSITPGRLSACRPTSSSASTPGATNSPSIPSCTRRSMARDAGLHLKTAGTTWLEEVVGLAAAGGEGLRLAKELYAAACERFDELAQPYRAVIAIDRDALPSPKRVSSWNSHEFVEALEHDPSVPALQPQFPPAPPHQLPGRRRDGRTVHRPPRQRSAERSRPASRTTCCAATSAPCSLAARPGGRGRLTALPARFPKMTPAPKGGILPRAPERSVRTRWTVCALLFFATTINYIDRQILGLLAPLLQKEIGWSELEYSYIVTAFQAAYALGLIAFGWFVDRYGTKLGYAVSIVIWSLAAAGHALVRTAFGFGVARAALGAGRGRQFPGRDQGRRRMVPEKGAGPGHGPLQLGLELRRRGRPGGRALADGHVRLAGGLRGHRGPRLRLARLLARPVRAARAARSA